MTKAYSYIRFSSAIQLKGDSLRRQLEASENWAKKHNLELDTSIRDLGVSAYTGENATTGSLAKFIENIEKGTIEKGSILIVESLDRLSRQTALTALLQFNNILSNGVEIVTLSDNQHYTESSINEMGTLMYSLMTMSRSHQESLVKAERGKATWDQKRRLAEEFKKPLTRQCPAWLKVNSDMTGFIVNEEHALIIKEIFKLSINNFGQRKIATIFNEKGLDSISPRAVKWNATYVRNILASRSVLGEFQPKHKGEIAGNIVLVQRELDKRLFVISYKVSPSGSSFG